MFKGMDREEGAPEEGIKEEVREGNHNCSKPDCNVSVNCCCVGEEVTFSPCQDFSDFTILGNRMTNEGIELACQARLLKIRVCLKNICKNRKLALGVLVCDSSNPYKVIGFKGKEVDTPIRASGTPACCTALTISEFCFVIPETNMCTERKFRVRIIAHYVGLITSGLQEVSGCPC